MERTEPVRAWNEAARRPPPPLLLLHLHRRLSPTTPLPVTTDPLRPFTLQNGLIGLSCGDRFHRFSYSWLSVPSSGQDNYDLLLVQS